MKFRFLLATLALTLAGLLAPAGASAVLYPVNTKTDAPDETINGTCDTAGAPVECSLRAAIEESNASPTVDDSIKFDGGFMGDPSDDKIVIGNPTPEITDKVKIFAEGTKPGLRCEPIVGILGPCVQIERTTAGTGLIVAAGEVEIRSVAIVGTTTGIDVVSGLDFDLEDSWIGILLNGGSGTNGTGVRLGPGTEAATIGGPNEGERDVFGNNGTGLDLEGSSFASISGNYFGVGPGGGVEPGEETPANNLGKDVEITDYSGAAAENNNVGSNLDPNFAGPPCDTSCNVFGSRNLFTGFVNIDLRGDGGLEEPASGPTFIAGNYIGLAADGTKLEQAEIGEAGIDVGGADGVMIGGPDPGQENHINGGSYGVLAGIGAEDLVVQGNTVGLNGDNTETISPPTVTGIFDSSEGVLAADQAQILENGIFMEGGVGIEQHGPGALIADNLIAAVATGLRLWGNDETVPSTIEGNVIENSFENGVLIENDENVLLGNEILGSQKAGIRIQNFLTLASTGNTIGGDTTTDENTISESQGDAIEVADDEDDETVIGRNHGSGNGTEAGDLFIDLGADGPGNEATGPNDGIQAPTISSATTTGASGGGARPGALVRVFRKATSAPSEIQSFLAQATADGAGNWSVTFPSPISGGINIAADQTEASGTSELTLATTSAPAPKEEGGTGGTKEKTKDVKNKNKGKAKGKKDKTPPQTTITKGPPGRTHKRTVKFKFVSSEAGSTFQCKLDRKPFKGCRSPKKLKRLKPGKHVFKVRAIDPAGNVDPTPAVKRFKVLK